MRLNKLKETIEAEDYIVFTTDLDWAPDVAIRDLLDMFKQKEIRPTVFVTHSSKEISKHENNIDVGIHPNLLQPSSQGSNDREILDYCCKLAPNTKVFRCHRWYSSNDVYKYLWDKGFRYESNLCTDRDIIMPFVQRSGMVCFPVFFEDGAHIEHGRELNYSRYRKDFSKNGLKVINIHPMHYALNTPYFSYTRNIKDTLSREEWIGMNEERLHELRFEGSGIREFIDDIVADAIERKATITTLARLYEMCQEELIDGQNA